MTFQLCNGKHFCPICKKNHKCDTTYGHENQTNTGFCNDGLESFCSKCQLNRDSEVLDHLVSEGRITQQERDELK